MKEIIRTLTVGERRAAFAIAMCVTAAGLTMAALGNGDPFGIHGYVAMAYGLVATIFLIRWYNLPPSSVDRAGSYYDEPIKIAVVFSLAWAVVGMLFGLWAALQLAWPSLSFDLPWSSFGRIRPDHTTGVIFGFGGNALIGTSFYVVQRSSRTRMPDQVAPLFVIFGYNLFCILGATGYLMGVTKSKEYAEPEWYAGLWLVTVWVVYLIVYLRTLARRKEPHIYVANWYYLAFIVIVAILYIVNNLAVPISFARSKSYPLFGGVQDAMTQWWYGHNAVAFFLTAGFLGMLYYFMPKRAGRPIYSYRISIISFWGITFFYIWVGSHHLHYTALPEWVQILGMSFSLMLLVPSWASAGNALMTLNGAWDKVRDDATLRFMMVAAVFYGLTTFEGSFMAIRPVNSLSHYTDWTIAHVHAGSLGWVAMITFGSLYAMIPWVWKKPSMYSPRLVEVHFWCALSGAVIYVLAMWNSGILQGLMWRTYNEHGALAYSFVDSVVAMHPYYIARAFGGLIFLIGVLVCCYNVFKTIRTPVEAFAPAIRKVDDALGPVPLPRPASAPLPRPAE